ncbi:hypothetical protein SPSIL_058260 [Sporomusa silvacetica DSM 10669]|uniref:KilA-N DNA-binding domain-containing protein n=1 Tax=Sporomusa silvacetica DSM 10669 TaxID=1123289 RepID=A0ABZ3IV98_9FIRM|nr:ORF6N domain-containing protein [Sporomusa silvacetica]OZC14226.1 ORF6N domain protein [Sporomusa silvacetica DSM 10669]
MKRCSREVVNLVPVGQGVSNISVKEYRGHRVVTFRDIDTVHQRPEGTAKRNFTENKYHFIENEDYFYITANQRDEIRTFEIPNRGLILITETGYLMLAKSFHDDLAWKVQRMLVKSYFRAKDQAEEKQLPPPGTTADILKENILTGKAFAEAMGLNEHQALMAAIAKTERQTGDDLKEFKRLLTSTVLKSDKPTDEEKATARVIAILREAGEMSQRDLGRKIRGSYSVAQLQEVLNRLKAANIASCQARNRSERSAGRKSIIWWLNDPNYERGET